jgi:hypothetical protein
MDVADKIGMNLRLFSFNLSRGLICFSLGIISLLFLTSMIFSINIMDKCAQERKPSEILWEIYEEITALERIENNSIIKGEFHINLDGNEENKEEHIVVLNHFAEGQERMLLQVTYFESRRKNSPVKYAKCIREIDCCIFEKRVEIERCDYNKVEINSILPGILEGIRDTKKILDLIQ